MALAIRLDQLIRDGEVADQAELARLGHVTRARLTQIFNLLCLASDIQEALLFLPATERGRDVVTEKQVRPIAAMADWKKQRRMWALPRLGIPIEGLRMTDKPNTPDDDEKIPHLENFLRPLEKQSREELDRTFENAKEFIAEDADLAKKMRGKANG